MTVSADAKDEAQRGACEAGGGAWDSSAKTCTGGSGDTDDNDLNDTIQTIINVMLFIVGVLSVIMIIWSGIRYVSSRGNTEAVKNAKDTLMYSIIGLVVAIIAFAIVNWVFSSIS
jgi:cytochrome bd-type quinol oxidase subunit 2